MNKLLIPLVVVSLAVGCSGDGPASPNGIASRSGVAGAEVTKTRLAINATIAVTLFLDELLISGTPSTGSESFTAECMHNAGFTGDHPIYDLVGVTTNHIRPPAHTAIGGAVLQHELDPGERITNLQFIMGNCIEGVINYYILEGEVE